MAAIAAKVSDDGDDGDEDRNLVWSATVPIPQDQLHTVGKYQSTKITSEIGAHVRINICILICLRHLALGREQPQMRFFKYKNTYFPLSVRNMFWVIILYK